MIDLAARAYVGAGLSIIPINPQTKRPYSSLLPQATNDDGNPLYYIKREDGTLEVTTEETNIKKGTWEPYQRSIADSETITRWLSRGIQSIAVVCGAVSGGLEILDFDVEGYYERWITAVGDMSEGLPTQRTGGGGVQVGWRCPSPDGNLKLAWHPDDEAHSGRVVAIETRGEGGYALLPPSMHPSGTRYELMQGKFSNTPTISQERRDSLLAAARDLCQAPRTRQEIERGTSPQKSAQNYTSNYQAPDVIEEYNRSNSITDMLARHGYTPGDAGRWSRPGQPGSSGVSVDVSSNKSYHFSSNDPLDSEKNGKTQPRDPFDYYVEFEHRGDYAEAMRTLGRIQRESQRPSRNGSNGNHNMDNYHADAPPPMIDELYMPPVGEDCIDDYVMVPEMDRGENTSSSHHSADGLVEIINQIANNELLKEPDKMKAVYALAPKIKEIDELSSRHIEVAASEVLGKTEARNFVRKCIRIQENEQVRQRAAPIVTDPITQMESDASVRQFFLGESADDEGNSLCVHHLYKDTYKFSPSYGWLENVGTHWFADPIIESKVNQSITDTLKMRRVMAVSANVETLIDQTKPTAARKKAVKSNYVDKVTISVNDFDKDKGLLNCKNGVVDLRSGKLLTRTPSDLFTYCVNAEYHAGLRSETWLNFLCDTVGNFDMIYKWFQMACGYSITGHTSEEIMFYLYGPTRSGKGTFTNALLNLLGAPLSRGVSFSMFTKTRDGDSQNFDLAPLKPARFVSASESGKYQTLNEAAVKQITGNDPISACFKHKDDFTFFPQFKIWLSSNHAVRGDVEDDAFWGRVKVIEFPNSHLGKEDKSLKERMLSAESMNAILAWAVQGAGMWYQSDDGLVTPTEIAQKTAQQRGEMDTVKMWLEECTTRVAGAQTANGILYQSYADWCEENGEMPKKANKFGQAMTAKGYERATFKDAVGKTKRGFLEIGIAM